jgi:DNA-binding NtrC family response regulator
MAEHQPAELIPREAAALQGGAVPSELVNEALEPAPLNLRVLVADSVESDRFSLTSILRRIDPSIETLDAANGPLAERILRERNIDIGFIDRRLPGFDGREVQNWASTSRQRSMFVLVSERLVPTWPEIATLISAYEVMLKPFNESHVENLLKVFSHIHRRSNVLIVDRSRTARKIIREMFGRLPFNVLVDETDTGAHALRAVKATHFDIVLVDAEVDDGMGAEAACRVARDAPRSKIILIGGEGMKTSRSALAQFDLSGFIQKPFNGAALESALHDVLKLWRPYRLNAQLRWPPPVVPELVVPAAA